MLALVGAKDTQGLSVDDIKVLVAAMSPKGGQGVTQTTIALGLLALVGVALMALLVGNGNAASDLLKTVVTALVTALTTVLGFYFGAKTAALLDAAAPADGSSRQTVTNSLSPLPRRLEADPHRVNPERSGGQATGQRQGPRCDQRFSLPLRADLERIVVRGWLDQGSIVVADNVKLPGAPDYRAHMRARTTRPGAQSSTTRMPSTRRC